MNIWIISAYETTVVDDTRPMRFMGIADAISSRGHHVTYFNNTFRHATKRERFQSKTSLEVKEKYEMVFIYSKPYKSNISIGRLLSHHLFAKNLVSDFKERTKPDVIFISMPPLTSVEKVTQWATQFSIPVVIDIIDPWPDVIVRLAPRSFHSLLRALVFPMRRKLQKIFKSVNGVTAISKEYIAWAKDNNSSLDFYKTFYPAVNFQEIRSFMDGLGGNHRISNKLTVIYAGSLGMSYDIPAILEAARLLEGRRPGKVEFIICGVGPQEKIIKDYEETNQNLRYLGRIGHNQLLEQYNSSDLGLIQHISNATQSVTYKLFDYLSAGLPVLNSLQSEVVDLIDENQLGQNNYPGDGSQLAQNIEEYLDHPEKS